MYFPTLVNYRLSLFMRQYPLFPIELSSFESRLSVQKYALRRSQEAYQRPEKRLFFKSSIFKTLILLTLNRIVLEKQILTISVALFLKRYRRVAPLRAHDIFSKRGIFTNRFGQSKLNLKREV